MPLPQHEADEGFAPRPETVSPAKPFGSGPPPELPMQVMAYLELRNQLGYDLVQLQARVQAELRCKP